MKAYRRSLRTAAVLLGCGGAGFVGAQVQPCWATVDTGQTACSIWIADYAPLNYCDKNFSIDQTVYRADRAGTGWSSKEDEDYECSGKYYTTSPGGACDVEHDLLWQTSGTEGTGNPCPGGPPQ